MPITLRINAVADYEHNSIQKLEITNYKYYMEKDILRRTKTLADYLGWVHPYNPSFHLEWSPIMSVYDKIKASDNNRWDIEITNNKITFIDSGKQRYEWERTNEKTMIEFLFYAFSQYVGYGMFNPA